MASPHGFRNGLPSRSTTDCALWREQYAVSAHNDQSSPGTFPFTATGSLVHYYSSAGMFDLRLTVTDDDGGMTESLIVIVIAF